jgi:hypothetical protein
MFPATAEDIHLTAPMPGHLEGHVGRAPKSVKAQPLAGLDLAQPEGSIADDTGAEQRSCFLVRKDLWDGIGELFASHHVLGIAPIHVIAGEFRIRAEIFPALSTELTSSAGAV